MSIIFDGKKEEVPGLVTLSFLDDKKKVPEATDGVSRTRWVRGIVIHTTSGARGKIFPGKGPDTGKDTLLARYQANTMRVVSWDYTVDNDGSVAVSNDPYKRSCFHAGPVNIHTVGIEMAQNKDREYGLWEFQLDQTVLLVDYLTYRLGIQRCIAWDKAKNIPMQKTVDGRLRQMVPKTKTGGDVVGVYGHRNVTPTKPWGDPGDRIYEKFRAAGYELFDLRMNEDLITWKKRQMETLMMPESQADGVAGPQTRVALQALGYKHGQWVHRPIDDLVTEDVVRKPLPA